MYKENYDKIGISPSHVYLLIKVQDCTFFIVQQQLDTLFFFLRTEQQIQLRTLVHLLHTISGSVSIYSNSKYVSLHAFSVHLRSKSYKGESGYHLEQPNSFQHNHKTEREWGKNDDGYVVQLKSQRYVAACFK